MNTNHIETISLDTLKRGYPGMTPAIAESHAEAAAICLEEQNHEAGVTFTISGSIESTFKLSWQSPDAQKKRAWADIQEATEKGACGIAALLIDLLTDLHVFERACKGTGFDYWLSEKSLEESGELNFLLGKERLEVSGILSGTFAEIKTRVKQKIDQTDRSDNLGLPAWIAIVEFSNPQSILARK